MPARHTRFVSVHRPRAALLLAVALVTLPARAADYTARGPFSVDTITLNWTDSARNRTLPLLIRVPVAAKKANDTGPDRDPERAADKGAAALLPVILFSHGLGGSREGGRAWGEHWASHGYLVIHLQHPGSDSAIWKDAGSKLAIMRGMKQAMSPEQLIARVVDAKFVLDELERRARAGDALARRADLTRVGMSGHSYGAITTQALAGERMGRDGQSGDKLADPRFKAFIAFSPSGGRSRGDSSPGQRFEAMRAPFLGITGSEDGGVASGESAADRLIPFAHMPGPDKYLLVLDGADHMVFNGQPEMGKLRRLRGRQADSGAADRDDTVFYPPVLGASTAFWDAYLRGDAAARRYLGSDAFERELVRADVWRSK
jgi:predicted dienelactone hydrolase